MGLSPSITSISLAICEIQSTQPCWHFSQWYWSARPAVLTLYISYWHLCFYRLSSGLTPSALSHWPSLAPPGCTLSSNNHHLVKPTKSRLPSHLHSFVPLFFFDIYKTSFLWLFNPFSSSWTSRSSCTTTPCHHSSLPANFSTLINPT